MIIQRASSTNACIACAAVAPDPQVIEEAAAILQTCQEAVRISGGGVLYSDAERELIDFCDQHGIPVGETQAGKSATPVDHPLAMGAVGVTGTGAANALAAQADVFSASARVSPTSHRLLGVVQESRPAIDQRQRAAFRRGQASRVSGRRRRADRARRARSKLEPGRRRAPGSTKPRRRRPSGRRPPPATPRRPTRPRRPTPKCSARSCARARSRTSSFAPRADCRANCTSCGERARRSATTSNTAIRAWATRSPAGSGSRWRCPTGKFGGPRRRLVSDDEFRDRHVRDAGQKLIIVVNDNRGFGCINRLQQATGARRSTTFCATRGMRRCRRSISSPMRARSGPNR